MMARATLKLGLKMSLLAALAMACSPSSSRVNEGGTARGPLQDHAIFFQVQIPSDSGTPTDVKYCVQMGALTDASTGTYNCNFFEYLSKDGVETMNTSVYNNGQGAPALCQTGPQPSSMPFTCIYSYTDPQTGQPVNTSCSTMPTSFLSGGQPLMFFTLSNAGGTWMAQGQAQAAQTDAGHPAPSLTNAQVIPGGCQNPALAALFPLPPSPAALQSPQSQNPGSAGTNPAATPGATTVSYALNASAAPAGTAIKTSTAQSSSLSEGTQKCTVGSGAVVKAELSPGSSSPSFEAKHYHLAKLLSLQVGTVPMCQGLIGKPVYIFAEHWLAQ